MNLFLAMKNRRTRYDITQNSPIPDERIQQILADAVTYTPSAFHSQSARVVLLLGEQHHALWQIVEDTLRSIVLPKAFLTTEKKIKGFRAGYGTVLYFEDMDTVTNLQQSFAQYAEQFPIWSNQSAGMLQYAVWMALSSEGLGASLQHYNPLIDEAVKIKFNLPTAWKLLAQMPFGTPSGSVNELPRKPINERLRILGGKL